MEIMLLIVLVVAIGVVVYIRSQKEPEKGKNATPPEDLVPITPEIREIMDEGHTVAEAVEIIYRREQKAK